MIEAIAWKYRTGSPRREVPERFGPWQTAYERFNRWSADGTWDRLLAWVQARADAAGDLDWLVAADSSLVRMHQHRHPRITLHVTPTSGSWLNLVEVFFSIITRQAIRRGSFAGVKGLIAAIERFIDGRNDRRAPRRLDQARRGAARALPPGS